MIVQLGLQIRYAKRMDLSMSGLKSSSTTSEILGLTSLRFFAAFHVLLFHAFRLLDQPLGSCRTFLEAGGTSVSFFFILSGFVLAFSHAKESTKVDLHSVRCFWRARFMRIYPLYFLGFVLSAPYTVCHFLKMNSASLAFKKTAVQGIASLILIQAWVPRMALTWNMPAWSLSVEAFFYFLFPFFAYGIWKIPRKYLKYTWLILYAVSLLGTLGFSELGSDFRAAPLVDVFLKFNPALRLPEFLIGIVLGRIFLACPYFLPSFPVLGLVTVLSILVSYCFSDRLPYYLFHNGLLIPLFSLLILSVALGRDHGLKWLKYPKLVFLGKASFALYILQFPVQIGVVSLLGLGKFHSIIGQILAVSLVIVLPIFVAVLACFYFDHPIQKWLRYRF